jgi:hypothetical protein
MTAFESCHYCKERYLGCHSICPKYLEEKAKWEEAKQIIAKNKVQVLTSYDFDSIAYVDNKRHRRRSK